MPAKRDEVGRRVPAGEDQGIAAQFSASDIATAFQVDIERVRRVMQWDLRLDPDSWVDSRTAQQLAEILLAGWPLDRREAALMELGAFTPRPDVEFGLGDAPLGEESDRLKRSAGSA